MRKSALLGIMLATVMFGAATVNAAVITVYTDKAQWESALSGQFLTEDFSDDQLNDGVSFVSTESGHINPAQGYYQDVLASESQNEPATTWSFTPKLVGFGGNWTLGGPGGSGNSLLVYIADSSLYVGAISNSYNGEFWGFTSDTPFSAVKLVGGEGTNQQNYSLDNMVYSHWQAGDLTCDGSVDFGDINPFVLALSGGESGYYAAWPDCYWYNADINADGSVDLSDINPFLVLLSSAAP